VLIDTLVVADMKTSRVNISKQTLGQSRKKSVLQSENSLVMLEILHTSTGKQSQGKNA
jgi:hypothetical protein